MPNPQMQDPRKNYLDEFDPNQMPEAYATYTYGRLPHFKLHSKLQFATSALTNNKRSGGVLYEREGDRWVERARFEPHPYSGFDPSKSKLPERCESCLLGTVEKTPRGWLTNNGAQYLQRERGKLVKPLSVVFLCNGCRRDLGY